MKRALFVGRFQPFHNGHMHIIREILKKYDEVIVVIGSAGQPRSLENPFTSGERVEMISKCLTKKELRHIAFVPVRDTNSNSLWVSHVIAKVPRFDVVHTNNPLVKLLFSQAGFKVQGITFHDRNRCEATKIRKMLAKGGKNWKKCVPKQITNWLIKNKAEERLRRLR